jgi:hypothetical protein
VVKPSGSRAEAVPGVRIFGNPEGGPFGAPHVYQREALVAKYFTFKSVISVFFMSGSPAFGG